jgi:hypothetical protein
VRAYAFLAEGAVEPLSDFVWPATETGPEWVDADAAPAEALRGYLVPDLPYWIDEELWSIELAGRLGKREHVVLAERARLRGRVASWDSALAWELVDSCARRVAAQAAAALREDRRHDAAAALEEAASLEELELAASSAAEQPPPGGLLAGYAADVCHYARDAGVAARGACVAAKMSAFALAGDAENTAGYDERLADERAWQAAWLADRLGL